MEPRVVYLENGLEVIFEGYSYPFYRAAYAELFAQELSDGKYSAKDLEEFQRNKVDE